MVFSISVDGAAYFTDPRSIAQNYTPTSWSSKTDGSLVEKNGKQEIQDNPGNNVANPIVEHFRNSDENRDDD